MSSVRALVLGSLVVAALATRAHAEDKGRAGAAYATAAAELTMAGVIVIHEYTSTSPARGIGLGINMLPLVVGAGVGVLAEVNELDPRYPLGFHGALAGGLSLLAIGAAFDGRDAHSGARLGPVALTLGALGAAGGAYLGATRIEEVSETFAFAGLPFLGALGGGITFAVVHFYDDEGPSSTGRLLKYAGAGMLLGTVGSVVYAWPERGDSTATRLAPSITRTDHATIVSFGGQF